MASLIENIESLLESLEVGCLWCLGEVFGLGGSGTERKAGRGAKWPPILTTRDLPLKNQQIQCHLRIYVTKDL